VPVFFIRNLSNKFNQDGKRCAAPSGRCIFVLFVAAQRQRASIKFETDSALLRLSALTADVTCTSTLFQLHFGRKIMLQFRRPLTLTLVTVLIQLHTHTSSVFENLNDIFLASENNSKIAQY